MSADAERFTETTRAVLEQAGWFPGRNVGDQVQQWKETLDKDGFEMFPAAERVLREFGGLSVRQRAEGLTAARESFALDPTVAQFEDDRFAAYSGLAASALYPLGEHGEGFLGVAEDGRVFFLADELWQIGRTIEDALEAMIQGIRGTLVVGDARWETS